MTVNIVITMMISMLLRKHEFAQLRSIGMSSKQFYQMILIEYLTLSGKGIVIGNGIGYGFAYLLYVLYMHIYGAFQYPWLFMIVFSLIVLCMAMILAYFTKQLMNKDSRYQTIKCSQAKR
ncbi:MAG: ABC transporter permease [Erysipelotrichaceae bacterium]|nr:ABC transporter permease [Erysipelotrichaceae bacterium]